MRHLISIMLFGFLGSFSLAQDQPRMRLEDKLRIKEAMDIAEAYGDDLWAGFNEVPFTLLLVMDSIEYLIHHPSPSVDFISLGVDPMLGAEVFHRARVFPPQLLATFPAVEGQSTIVVGTPENTGKRSAEWILTVLHEHFHQYQSAAPDHYRMVDSLDLSGGDRTGMWMLNYPFPYQDERVLSHYANYMAALAAAVKDRGTALLSGYKEARERFKSALDEKDYRYFSFQLWQEGLARYTEYRFADLVSDRSLPQDLPDDGTTYTDVRDELIASAAGIESCDLAVTQRACFYEVGLAEGLLLDRLAPEWREQYLRRKFFVEQYMPE